MLQLISSLFAFDIFPYSIFYIILLLPKCRELEPDHYSVWHAWAVTNYDQLKKLGMVESAQLVQ
jgi:hypothetical protein